MKKIMIISFLAIMVMVGACGKGSEEVAPTEIPTKGTEVVKETIKKDSIPTKNETPCEKDSTPISSERVDIAMGIIKELAPQEKANPDFSYPIVSKPFYFIINSAESEVYKRLVSSEGKPLTPIDFEKNSLVVAGMVNPHGTFVIDQKLTNVCKEGKLQCDILLNGTAGSAAFTPVNFSFAIPKVKEDTKINFNIIH